MEEGLRDMDTFPIDPAKLTWRKSRRSDGGNGCVEVAVTDAAPADTPHKAGRGPLVLFRDSEDPAGPVLAFTRSELQAFFAGVKDGEFDDLT
jgi:hypothetical protein